MWKWEEKGFYDGRMKNEEDRRDGETRFEYIKSNRKR